MRYLNALSADEFTSIDVAVVDAMIYDHQESFQKAAHLPVCVRAPCVYTLPHATLTSTFPVCFNLGLPTPHLQVPEFKGFFKPKNHYLAHASLDILKLGPIRGFWCWSFEGFHRVMKHIAADSNFKNVSKRLSRIWRFQFGLRCYGG